MIDNRRADTELLVNSLKEYVDNMIKIRSLSSPDLFSITNTETYSYVLLDNFKKIGMLADGNDLWISQSNYQGEKREMSDRILSFDRLVENVESVHAITSSTAKGAVNQLLTVRNWAIGYYIVEFEQKGSDRAEYGISLLASLADKISIKGLDRTRLNQCRIFYIKYPQICETVSHKLQAIGGAPVFPTSISSILPVSTVISETEDKICETASHKFESDPEILISRLSFSHIVEIMKLDDPFERFFYEYECIKGVWSVRELQRQINTNHSHLSFCTYEI